MRSIGVLDSKFKKGKKEDEEKKSSHRSTKSQIKIYNEQALPEIQEGITLDKYFGCTFTAVD